MSALFVARRHNRAGRGLVAVKVLRHRTQRDIETLLRLRDSCRALAGLRQRHIVVPQDVAFVGGFPALVSPYVEGIDLLDWVEVLRETGVLLPGRVVCEILRSAAVALDAAMNRAPAGEAQALGKVHRDLKPSNMMVDRDGELKVLDFGVGFTSLAGRGAHRGALQKGLIKYMSPERRIGHRGTVTADVYSLGILAIELFRGRWLRRLRSQNPAHDRHLAEVVATMGELGLRKGADDAQCRSMLLRMVAFDPDARPLPSEIAHTFRTLVDRAPGPSLESFAQAHALPWMEPVPTQPDDALEEHQVGLLKTGATSTDLPVPDGFRTGALHERKVDDGAFWVETKDGWKQADWGDDTAQLERVTPPEITLVEPPVKDHIVEEPDEVEDPWSHLPQDTEWEEAGPSTTWEQEDPEQFYKTVIEEEPSEPQPQPQPALDDEVGEATVALDEIELDELRDPPVASPAVPHRGSDWTAPRATPIDLDAPTPRAITVEVEDLATEDGKAVSPRRRNRANPQADVNLSLVAAGFLGLVLFGSGGAIAGLMVLWFVSGQ